MHVYLDESGDTGFKFLRGSSRYFVLALLLVDDPIPLHQAVHDLRLSLRLPEVQEFRFSAASHQVRTAFFQAIRPYVFHVRCLVVDKTRLKSPRLRTKETMYNYLVRLLLDNDFGTIRGAALVIDESVKSKGKKAHLAYYLRRELNTSATEPKIERVVYHESHRDNLIQVADMVVGAIARQYERGDTQYRQLLRGKIQNVWEFPG